MASMKDFAQLRSLRESLKEQEHKRAIEKAEREKRERIAQHEANLFRSALGGVTKMPESNRYVPNTPAGSSPAPPPQKFRTQAEDDAAVLRESLSDDFDVEHLLEDAPGVAFSRYGIGPDVLRRLRKGYWQVQDELDLHGMRRDAARDQLGDFLRRAVRRKLRCVCIIHGKGLGSAGGEPVLRSMVHSWLEQKEDVIAFCATNMDGQPHGALIVLLRAAIAIPQR